MFCIASSRLSCIWVVGSGSSAGRLCNSGSLLKGSGSKLPTTITVSIVTTMATVTTTRRREQRQGDESNRTEMPTGAGWGWHHIRWKNTCKRKKKIYTRSQGPLYQHYKYCYSHGLLGRRRDSLAVYVLHHHIVFERRQKCGAVSANQEWR